MSGRTRELFDAMTAEVLGILLLCLLGARRTSAYYDHLEIKNMNPDSFLSTPELIIKYGYPVESHTVQTEDGYILTLHRIPHGKNPPVERKKKPPVYVQHGLLSSSADWIVMGPQQGFGYILADAGYDVWLGNARGNTWSKNHISKPIDSAAFWDFSWHEMGVYDLPAVIDYILETTGEEKLFYVGYSMGTTMFYVMASEKPEYNSKIRAMFSLAPVAFLPNVKTPFLKLISQIGVNFDWLLKLMGVNEFLPNSELMVLMGQVLCRDEAITQIICSNVLFLIAGYNSQELNKTMLPVILGHTPAGSPTKNFIHYAQSINTAKFCKYDYGLGNWKHYNSLFPPEYDLSKITAPVSLHYSDNDWLAVPKDVEKLNKALPNVIGKFRVPQSSFNHLDFVWAINAKTLLYDKVISLMSWH